MSGVDETPNGPQGAAERARLEALRRVAFGRTRSLADEAAAAAALAALRAEEERAALHHSVIEHSSEDNASSTPAAPAPEARGSGKAVPLATAGSAASAHRARGTARLLVPAVSVIAAVGAIAAAVALAGDAGDLDRATTAPTNPSPASPLADARPFNAPGSAGAGSVVAAAQWFLEPQSLADEFPGIEEIEYLDADSTRLVWGGDGDWSLWVATTAQSELCLLASSPTEQQTVYSCASQAEFLESGLTLTHSNGTDPQFSVFWNGNSITQNGD